MDIGVAAHITAASPGGPRYDPEMSSEARRSAENGIWLCQDCAKLVDSDTDRYPATVLRDWKLNAEREAAQRLGVRAAQPDEVTILDSVHGRLERDANPRFGFSFLHPSVWDRDDPENGGGNTYRHPTDPRIEIRAWGGYAVVSADLEAWVAWTMNIDRIKPGFELVSKVRAGGRIVDWRNEPRSAAARSTQQIDGYRIVVRTDENGVPTTGMQTFLQVGDTQISFLCRAPTHAYDRYEDLFLVVSKEIYVLGPSSAPYARTGWAEKRRLSFWSKSRAWIGVRQIR